MSCTIVILIILTIYILQSFSYVVPRSLINILKKQQQYNGTFDCQF